MFVGNIKNVIEQISKDKGIEPDTLIKTIEDAIESAARKKLGSNVDIEVHYDKETGNVEVFQFKEVVEKVQNKDKEMDFVAGKKLDSQCQIGDVLGFKIDIEDFGRIAAQSAKQVIIQKMKYAEKNVVYMNFIERKGENIYGIVQQVEKQNIIVNLGATEAILPSKEQCPNEKYKRGDRIKAYILDVLQEVRGPQVILSRTHPGFLINLFKTEVPEISDGTVKIVNAVREPGSRAKISVYSDEPDVDPVGACVGIKGSRVQNVVQELKGEKIDIINWSPDPAKYVCHALAPAEISKVILDDENKSMEVIISDEFLSIAIGKGGQNVKLASKLTDWKIDVRSESGYEANLKENYEAILKITNDNKDLIDSLKSKGFETVEDIAFGIKEEMLNGIITSEIADDLIQKAQGLLKEKVDNLANTSEK